MLYLIHATVSATTSKQQVLVKSFDTEEEATEFAAKRYITLCSDASREMATDRFGTSLSLFELFGMIDLELLSARKLLEETNNTLNIQDARLVKVFNYDDDTCINNVNGERVVG